MNRRIVIIDPSETQDYLRYWGLGLETNEIYLTTELSNLNESTRKQILVLHEGDGALLVGGGGFKYFFDTTGLHAGIRSENWADCVKLSRLSVEGGCYVKVIDEFPDQTVVDYFKSQEFTKDVDFSWFKSKVIHDFDGACRFLDWLDSLPENEYFGYDVEASGMGLDKFFELSGLSLCNRNFGAFISLTDLRHTTTQEQYAFVMNKIGQFLYKRQSYLVTYHMAYEQFVSHRMFGVDLYNLLDASVCNVLSGFHLKKYSLKWTAQRVLKAKVWDTEFDWLSETIEKMLYTEEGKLKKEKHKVLKVTPDNFENTEEWRAICNRYPNYVDEFRALIIEYFGNCYLPIASDILGKYCNLDAFYTLMIYLVETKNYSEDAVRTFMDNARLGARLHNGGLYIDEPFRVEYRDYCKNMMVWGIMYCATARCYIKMEKHAKKMAKIDKYSDIAKKLLYKNKFFNGDPKEIAKYLLTDNVDTLDAYELGLNEGKLLMEYGPDFAGEFIECVRRGMEGSDMIKLYKKSGEKVIKRKIDETVGGKKKLIQLVGEEIIPLIGLDKIKINEKHIELEKYLYYERAYNELQGISKTQLNDINNIPREVTGFGRKFTDLEEFSNYISDNYFKSRSPIENNAMTTELAELFRAETAYLASMFESVQQLNGAEKFYENLGIKTIEDAFNHFMKNWESYEKGTLANQTDYPEKAYLLAQQFYKDPGCEQMREVWSNFNGFISQEQFFSYVSDQYKEYGEVFKPDDLGDRFFFMRKLVISYLLNKKYAKVLSTYIEGLFGEGKWVIEDKNHLPIREADPDEPGAIKKSFARYEVNTKSSKRWSSAYHTIISHADFKNILRTPFHYDENGNIVDEDFIETYFDISSAEVKAAGYASGDPDLIAKFNKGEDIYIYSAKLYLGDKFDSLDKKQKKMWRKRFKTVFLGVLYGLGKRNLASKLNCSEEEAEHIINGLYTSFPKLREYIAKQQQSVFDAKGYLNMILGDKLKIHEFDLWLKATDRWEKRNLEEKCKRLAVNLPIQGGTASIMASGFFNNIRESIKQGWETPLQPIIVVHDSNTNYVPTSKIFEIRKFYDTYYTDFCASFGPKIRLLFDLLAGDAYESAMPMTMIDDKTIEFTGSADSIIRMYNRIMKCKDLVVECDTKIEDIVPKWVTDPIQKFILEKGTCLRKDLSSYTVRFKKLN